MYLVADLRGMGNRCVGSFIESEELATWSHQPAYLSILSWSTRLGLVRDFGRVRGERLIGMLLLERFYRSAIYIAGSCRYWCTTPGGDADKHSKTARLASRMDFDESMGFVDLGYVELPQLRVRRRAMLGILNHHPVSPMTTLLELVLILHGANASSLLCDHMKSRIFRGSEAVSVVDPYLLLFDAASVALSYHGNWERFGFFSGSLP